MPRLPLAVCLAGFVLVAPMPARGAPNPVSPGEALRSVEVAHACPTFSWSGDPSALGYEIALIRIEPEGEATEVFTVPVPSGTSAWSPGAARCLSGEGHYAWLVRGLDGDGAGEWSAPSLFHFEARPAIEELAEALAIVERYLRTEEIRQFSESEDPPGAAPGPSAGERVGSGRAAAITPGASSAVRGELPDDSGPAFGIVGVSSSPGGAGVAAHNTAGGPDLVLDGPVPAGVTEGGLEVDSAGLHVFDFHNAGAGAFSLRVDGAVVSTDGHAHAAGELPPSLAYVDAENSFVAANDFTAADVGSLVVTGSLTTAAGAEARFAEAPHFDKLGQPPLAVKSLDLVTNLNADLLDGLHAGDLAPLGHGHPGLARPGFDSRVVFPLVDGVSDTSATIGIDGLPVIAVQVSEVAGEIVDETIKVVHCDDLLCSSATVTQASNVKNSTQPAIAIGADGNPVVAFAVDGAIFLARCTDVACTDPQPALQIGLGFGPDVALGPNGFPYVSHGGADEARVAVCLDPHCSILDMRIVDSAAGFVTETAISIDGDGLPIVAYHDDLQKALRVAHCQDSTCSTALAGVAHTGQEGQNVDIGSHPASATGPDGGVWISYQGQGSGGTGIFVMRCSSDGCEGPRLVESVETQDLGPHSSIAIDASGLPLVTYRNASEGLKAARCRVADCGAISTVVAVTGMVGGFSSVTLGVDGLPFVSYQDELEGELEVVHCSNWHCVPWYRRR